MPWNQNFQNNARNVQKVPNSNNNRNFFGGKTFDNTSKNMKKNEFITPKINPPVPAIKSIKEEFPFHQGIALRNVGATCYMNATLQCLCNIEKLVSYFKYHQTIENYIQSQGKTTLTYSFKYLVENLWQSPGNKYILPEYNGKNSNNKFFSPIRFKDKISTMNPLFKGAQANDAKDLVNFIIMTLHEELNKIKKSPDMNKNYQIINQTNHDLVLNYFIQNFSKENKSIISDLFYAMSGTYTQCSQCNEIKYNFQNYFFLIFPLEEVRKFKIQNLINSNCQNMMFMNPLFFQQNQFNNIQSVNMDDCFQYNEKIEIFSGENAMYCNKCNGQFKAGYKTRLYYGPEILIIVLNRGKGIEFKVKLEFTEQINLSQYFQLNNFGNVYNLIGVVTHMGESGASGHFIANAKSPIDGQWYTYNDDLVSKVHNFKQQIIDYAMPYILFYQKQK
jgi:ubiquitin C-terminal hydrolase